MRKLTFIEVITNIKEGEVWESDFVKITKDAYGDIDIIWKEDKEIKVYTFASTTGYELKRKQYSFKEAFKAYEEGKEIESMVSTERYRLVDGIDEIYAPEDGEWAINTYGLDLKEVRGKWYINN